MTMPATRAVNPMATSSGRNDGGGRCTPSGGARRGAGRAPITALPPPLLPLLPLPPVGARSKLRISSRPQ